MRPLLTVGAVLLAPAFASLAAPAVPAASPATSPANPPAMPPAAADHDAILALAREGRLDSARAAARKALSARLDDVFLLLLLGKLSAAGQESADYLKRAIQAGSGTPEAEEALFRLGQYTYATGKYYLAIPHFRDYLRRYDRGDWKHPALYWMGNACLALARSRDDRMNYLDSGAAWFRKLLEDTRPGEYYHPLALEGLAKAKAGRGDREGAWQTAQEALANAPEEEKPPLLLLAAQTRQGVDRAAEKSLLAQLVAKYPQSPETRYLRRFNANADTSRWKSGPGLPRAPQPARDSSDLATGTGASASASAPAGIPAARPAHDSVPAYTLQCGAYTQAANAQSMLSALSKLGLSPETVERERGGKRIYQVRVGRFASPEAAEAFARERLKPQKILSQPVPVDP